MLEALETHDATRGFTPTEAFAEHVARLDSARGEHRNHDLVVIGESGTGRVLVGVEAKAGEAFGEPVGPYFARRLRVAASRLAERVALLVAALTGDLVDYAHATALDHVLAPRGYQLLTAAGGTVIEAHQCACPTAVLLVHELISDPPTAKEAAGLPAAHADLDAFVSTLTGGTRAGVSVGEVVGPFQTHPTRFVTGEVTLLIGACRTTVAPHQAVQ
jgi:hypothetical protein